MLGYFIPLFFSIGIFSIYILSSCNLTLVLKSRVHSDAIRIHDDDDDDDLFAFSSSIHLCCSENPCVVFIHAVEETTVQ